MILKKLFPLNLVGKSMAIYGKCGNVRIWAKIKGIYAILESRSMAQSVAIVNKVWQ